MLIASLPNLIATFPKVSNIKPSKACIPTLPVAMLPIMLPKPSAKPCVASAIISLALMLNKAKFSFILVVS